MYAYSMKSFSLVAVYAHLFNESSMELRTRVIGKLLQKTDFSYLYFIIIYYIVNSPPPPKKIQRFGGWNTFISPTHITLQIQALTLFLPAHACFPEEQITYTTNKHTNNS